MDYVLAIAIVVVIILIWLNIRNARARAMAQASAGALRAPELDASNLESSTALGDVVQKIIPREEQRDAVIIDSIPMSHTVQPEAAEDPSTRIVYSDEKAPVTLTFDAAVARNALMRSRDKRVFDAIANRTTDYYRPFYEEELSRCDNRDWWDDVAYPMNDSGESVLIPEQAPSDREDTPWDNPSMPFGRSAI